MYTDWGFLKFITPGVSYQERKCITWPRGPNFASFNTGINRSIYPSKEMGDLSQKSHENLLTVLANYFVGFANFLNIDIHHGFPGKYLLNIYDNIGCCGTRKLCFLTSTQLIELGSPKTNLQTSCNPHVDWL